MCQQTGMGYFGLIKHIGIWGIVIDSFHPCAFPMLEATFDAKEDEYKLMLTF